MARYLGIPVLLLAAMLDATLMAEFRLAHGAPDLVFLLVISWALLVDTRDALLWALIGGVLQDLFSIAPLGTSALGLVVVVALADALFGQISPRNLLIPLLVVAAGTLIDHALIVFTLRATGTFVPLQRGLLYVTVPTLLYNLLLILPVFHLVGRVHTWMTPRRVRLD
jgi:rod shape-determining protein MreD